MTSRSLSEFKVDGADFGTWSGGRLCDEKVRKAHGELGKNLNFILMVIML